MNTITVKAYMTKKSSAGFDFMKKWNNDVPMPLRVMVVDEIVKETKGMIYAKLHCDILEEQTTYCMKCGKPLTNPVSKFFGLGPECGGHNYVHPFETEEQLRQAVESYRKQLNEKKWEGWIIKSAIVSQTEQLSQPTEQPQPKVKAKSVVTIEVAEARKLEGAQSAFITFEYDVNLVAMMRNRVKRYWHADTKQWEIPAKHVTAITEHLDRMGYEYKVIGQELNVEEPTEVVDAVPVELTNIPFEFKTAPFSHQVEGFQYGLQHDRFLLGDEQGLGKTKQVIDILVAKKQMRQYKHCLILCGVNSLKHNWKREVSIHSNERAFILGETSKAGGNKTKLYNLKNIDKLPYFIITNIESLRDKDICEQIKKLCDNGTINAVAVDEIHKCKNPTSQQGKALLKISAETIIAMTGTPLMNNPLDLYVIFKWLGYENHGFYAFRSHYCVMGGFGGYQVVGYRNLNKLQETLADIMVRRLKKDVLDLPEKLYTVDIVEMSKAQQRIYDEVYAETKANIDKIKISANPLAQFMRLRQATGHTGILSSSICESAKLDRLEQIVEELAENGQKAIVFSNWTQMTDQVMERLSKYNPAVITGQTENREAEQDKFMQDNTCKVIVGTIGAMGTGLTLTAASTVIFLDSPWTMAAKVQAEDRAHRIGTKQNVNIITLVCKGTIDERIEELVNKKGLMADALVDGNVAGNRGELVDFLLS